MPKKSASRTLAVSVRKLLAEHNWTDECRFLTKELFEEIERLAATPSAAVPATRRRKSHNCRWERQPDGSLKWVCD